MKKFYLTTFVLVFLLSTLSLRAGDGKDTLNAEISPYPSFKGFVTNKFWDNWEISLNFGTGFSVYSSNNQGAWGDRFGVNGEFSVAKWLHPVVGVRAGLQGGNFNTVRGEDKIKWPFLYGHVDAMLNMSNWISGYKENRVYYAVLFAGMGLYGSNFTDASKTASGTMSAPANFAFTAGLTNKFRVSPSVDINLELRGILGMSSLNPVSYSGRGRFLGNGDISVGVTYRFGKRDFQRGAAGYTLEDINTLKREAEEAALTAQQKESNLETQITEAQENAAMAQQRADNAEKELEKANKSLDELRSAATPEEMVFFDFGMAVLTPADQIRLTVLADQIKKGPQDYVYTITGYADFNTGTQDRNTALSVKRAKTVYDFLISLGVPAEQLAYSGTDRNSQPFSGEGNQTVIIR